MWPEVCERHLLFFGETTDAFHRKNLQVPYEIGCPLSTYVAQVSAKKWEFPSFRECCLICGAKDCAKRHGWYERRAVEEDGSELLIPVPRWRCGGKGNRPPGVHRTFSLLPDALVPYRRYCAKVQYATFRQEARGGVVGALDALQADIDGLCDVMVLSAVLLFQAAFFLLLRAGFVRETHGWKEALIELVDDYEGGLAALGSAFYAGQREFLLGMPSQGRRPGKKRKPQ
jgi:hypothetical protein